MTTDVILSSTSVGKQVEIQTAKSAVLNFHHSLVNVERFQRSQIWTAHFHAHRGILGIGASKFGYTYLISMRAGNMAPLIKKLMNGFPFHNSPGNTKQMIKKLIN